MGVDEKDILPISYNERRGYWKVGEKCFFDKATCLKYGTSINDFNVTFHFFDEAYKNLKWTEDIDQSLDDLYRLRAQHLRDKYDYLALSFSGGEDSKNILDAFIKNKIKLDEVISYAPVKALEKLSVYFNASNKAPEFGIFEYYSDVVPVFNSLRVTNPEIKLTVIDTTEKSIDLILGDNVHKISKAGYSPSLQFLGGNLISEKVSQIKKSCIITGHDKPRIIYDPATNKFGQTFHDLASTSTDYNDQHYDRQTVSEGFYYTPEMPEIVLKQSIAIKRVLLPIAKILATSTKLNPLILWKRLDGMIELNVHDPFLERALYPSLEFPSWQADKVTSFFYMESGNWLLDSSITEKRVSDFFNGQIKDFISGVHDNFVVYKNGKASHFKHYYTSINWL